MPIFHVEIVVLIHFYIYPKLKKKQLLNLFFTHIKIAFSDFYVILKIKVFRSVDSI